MYAEALARGLIRRGKLEYYEYAVCYTKEFKGFLG